MCRMSFLERSRRAHREETVDDGDGAGGVTGADEEERDAMEDPGVVGSSELAQPSSGGRRDLRLRFPVSEAPSESARPSGGGWKTK